MEPSRKTVAETVYNYAHVVTEVCVPPKHDTVSTPPMQKGQTDILLKAVLGSEFAEGDSKQNVSRFLQKIGATYCTHHKAIFVQALEEEKKNPDHVVTYHGTNSKSAFLFDLFTQLRKELYLLSSPDIQVFRLTDEHFIFKDAEEFLAKNKGIADWATKYQKVALVTNLFLFGNYEHPGESSIAYFLENVVHDPADMAAVLDNITDRLGISRDHSTALSDLYKKFQKSAKGRLYQIFIHKEVVDHVAFCATPGGFVRSYECDGKKTHSLKKIIDVLQNNEKTTTEDLDWLQARIYLKPEHMYNPKRVQTKVYFASNDFPNATYKQELQKLVRQMVLEVLTTTRALREHTFVSQPPLITHYERLCKDIDVEILKESDPVQQLTAHIQTGDLTAIKKLLHDTPSLDTAHLTHPETGKSIDAVTLAFESQHYEVCKSLFDIVMNHGRAHSLTFHFQEVIKTVKMPMHFDPRDRALDMEYFQFVLSIILNQKCPKEAPLFIERIGLLSGGDSLSALIAETLYTLAMLPSDRCQQILKKMNEHPKKFERLELLKVLEANLV